MTGPEVTAAMKAEDVDAGLVEKAARAMWSIPPQDPDSALAWPSWDVAVERADAGLWDLPQMVADTRNLARHALAAVLPEIQAQALRDAADQFDRDAAEYHAASEVAGVRCPRCNLRYEERDQYSCGEPGHGHEYDEAELLEAGELHIERTARGDELRKRAARLTTTTEESPCG